VAKGGSEELKEIERDGNWRTSPSLFNQPGFLIHPPDAKTATLVGWYHLIHLFQTPSSVNCSEVGTSTDTHWRLSRW
jgi:hypothetical protein